MFGEDKVWRIASSKVVGERKFGECLQQRCAAYEMDWRVKKFGWFKFKFEFKFKFDGLSLANALLFTKLSRYTV